MFIVYIYLSLVQMVETLFSSLAECMWKSPVELAQLEAEDKERKLTEEMETLKSPLETNGLESRTVTVKGSNSDGKVMGSNSLGKFFSFYTPV